jgi:hypothetical protein
VNQDGQAVQRTRIHEVWTSAEMQLIIRVIDGDPKGEESIWGLEKISLKPDPALFQPPDGFEIEHRTPGQLLRWGVSGGRSEYDFEQLKSWFEKLAVSTR